jgi:hypothetical protein
MDAQTRAEVDHLKQSLHGWALGDVKKAADASAPIGAFILGAHLIDTLARLMAQKRKGRPAWEEFVPRYLPRYAGPRVSPLLRVQGGDLAQLLGGRHPLRGQGGQPA